MSDQKSLEAQSNIAAMFPNAEPVLQKIAREEQPKNEDANFARARMKLPLVFDYCQANPKQDPYVEMTARLLINFPNDEEQIIHNFIDALTGTNMKMKAIIMNLNVEMAAMEGKGIVIPNNEVVLRGKGPKPPPRNGGRQ